VTKEQLLTLDGFKERSAQKFLDAVIASRKNYLNQLLVGFGIPNCGRSLSAVLAEKYETLDAVCSLTKTEFISNKDIGEETALSIVQFFKENSSLVDFFVQNQIATKSKPGIKKVSTKLLGKSLIMTGSSDKIGRQEFKDLVVAHGGAVVSGISKKVNFVIVGEEAGPEKLKKIDELKRQGAPIKTINDTEFLKMIA